MGTFANGLQRLQRHAHRFAEDEVRLKANPPQPPKISDPCVCGASRIVIEAVDEETKLRERCTSLPDRVAMRIGETLRVSKGAQKGIVGSLVKVQKAEKRGEDSLLLKTESDSRVKVARVIAKRVIKQSTGTRIATRAQFAVKTAAGQTVHGCQVPLLPASRQPPVLPSFCAQGKSMRSFVVACSGFWAHGQAYTALSRAIDVSKLHLIDVDKLWFACEHSVSSFYRAVCAQALPSYATD